MKNTVELRNELSIVFERLKSGTITNDEVKSVVSISNSMIRSASIDVVYNRYMGKSKPILFLEND